MEIVRVIVDEMPSCCEQCKFNHHYTTFCGNSKQWESKFSAPIQSEMLCDFTMKRLKKKHFFEKRPDWCPLILRQDVIDFLMQSPTDPNY